MKVVGKFALAFFVACCLCLAMNEYLAAHDVAIEFERSASTDLSTLGHALAAEIERRGDPEGTLAGARAAHSTVELRYIADVQGATESESLERRSDGTRRVHVVVPVHVGDALGEIEIARGIPSEREILRDELTDQLFVAFVLAIVLAMLAISLGGWVIGARRSLRSSPSN